MLSIIIPTYNRCKLLQETIDSCLLYAGETEIIVVDHGSTDSTPSVIPKKYKNKIQYIRREIDHGPIFAWLDGVMLAKNEWIHMQFDDDLIRVPLLKKIKSYLKKEVGFVLTSVELIDEKSQPLGCQMYADLFASGIYPIKKIEAYTMRKMISPGAVIIRKGDAINAFYQGELPNERIRYHGVGPDVLLTMLPQMKYSHFAYINENVFQFREHSSSITYQSKENLDQTQRFHFAYDEVRKYFLGHKYLRSSLGFRVYCFIKLFNIKNIYLYLRRIRSKRWVSLLDWLKTRLTNKS